MRLERYRVRVSKAAHGLARGFGFDFHRVLPPRRGYESFGPVIGYAPWSEDQQFLDVYTQIRPYTMVDRYRCYELWWLVAQTRHLEGALLEVGTWRGGTGAVIAKSATNCGIDDPVYLCDTFAGVVKASVKDPDYVGGEHANASRQMVEQLLEANSLNNARVLEGVFPEETGAGISSLRFRFCHIDVDVYDSAKDVAKWVWGRMPVGGIVVYDDYEGLTTAGITQLVNEQLEMPDRIVVHNLNGHAVIVKVKE